MRITWGKNRVFHAGFVRRHGTSRRSYAGAQGGRLFADWLASYTEDRNEEIKRDLATLRQRSVDLYQNHDYVKKFVRMVSRNIVGPEGLQLQPQATDPDGTLDTAACEKISLAWWQWGSRPEYASVTGRLSFLDLQGLAAMTAAREGEALVRLVRGHDNPWRFALQVVPPDLLPVGLNREEPGGRRIVMGIEYDEWDRPLRYYLKQKHNAPDATVIEGNHYRALPAREVVHLFLQDFASQARGLPWLHTAMHRLKMLDGYEDAELVAARAAACKMGFLETETGEGFVGDEADSRGNALFDAEPGTFPELPAGMKVTPFDPTHPTSQFPTFVKMLLTGIAAGGDVAYASLTGDLEKVNYSSIRAGSLDERDAWRVLQTWFGTHFCQPIFSAWLEMALLTRQLELPPEKFEKFHNAYWQGRGWDWVDPLKDMKAAIAGLGAGMTSWRREAAKRGIDVDDLFREIAADRELAAKYGLTLNLDQKGLLAAEGEEDKE